MGDPDIEHWLAHGEAGSAAVMERLYAELRRMAERLMRGERAHHTLQPTALVHEAFLRLADAQQAGQAGRLEFLQAAAVSMRRVLVDHARARNASKRGGGWERITLQGVALDDEGGGDVDLQRLDELLVELESLDPRQARIVELRFFGDMTGQEIADVLGVSRPTVVRELAMARAWLRRQLELD
jgi:RNA polymerase sigma factor (TIGR02999 family)